MKIKKITYPLIAGIVSLPVIFGVPISCNKEQGLEKTIQQAESDESHPPQEVLGKMDFFENSANSEIKAAYNSLDRSIDFFSQSDLFTTTTKKHFGISSITRGAGPIMGRDFLLAFETTGNENYLDLAKQVGDVLVENQLKHGGWRPTLYLTKEDRDMRGYFLDSSPIVIKNSWGCSKQVTPQRACPPGKLKESGTQIITKFLIRLGKLSGESKYSDAAQRGLEFLLEAQHGSGGWPNAYPPEVREGYSEDELIANQLSFDDLCTETAIHTMIGAYKAYGDKKYLDSALKGGEFILKTQNTKFGGWPQQVNPVTLEPSWGRGRFTTIPEGANKRFITPQNKDGWDATGMEPPALYPVRNASVIRTDIDLYFLTGDERFFNSARKGRDFLDNFARVKENLWYHWIDVDNGKPFFVIREDGASTGGRVILDPDFFADIYYRTLHQASIDKSNAKFALNWEFYPTLGNPYSMELSIETVNHLEDIGREEFLREYKIPTPALVTERLEYLKPLVDKVISSQRADGSWVDDGTNANMDGRLGCSESSMTIIGEYFDYQEGNLAGSNMVNAHAFDRNSRILCEYLNLQRLNSQYSRAAD